MKERKTVIKEVIARYAKASKTKKHLILNEFIELTGYNRKYAINLLNSCFGKVIYPKYGSTLKNPAAEKREFILVDIPKRKKRVYLHKYGHDVAVSLGYIWSTFNYMCGQRLEIFIKENLDSLSNERYFRITPSIKEKLKTISSATINRLLRQKRKERNGKGMGTTKAGISLNKLIPIRVFFEWDERVPGFFEVDTVSHDGGNASGEHCYTVTMTDVCTGWTELRAFNNKAQVWVKNAIDEIKNGLPYPMKGIDSDNGTEFKNILLFTWCKDNQIDFTRSRSYKKNDNCFVEQKNNSVVRNIVGYFRYQGDKTTDKLNNLYKNWCLLVNYFYPSVKIIEKKRKDAHTYKRYDLAKTPFTRTLENENISTEIKESLVKAKAKLNLVAIRKQIEKDICEILPLALKTVWI